MQGKFNGLKTLILNENKYAYSIHCFSHQLQLTLVALARKNNYVGDLLVNGMIFCVRNKLRNLGRH